MSRESGATLVAVLDRFRPRSPEEAADVERIRQLAAEADPWPRSLALHATGSAVIVHPPTRRVLLRWHERMQAWLQVGGHADPGEAEPYAVARREAEEETSLVDLTPWPEPDQPTLIHVAIVPVPASTREPAHQHADFRFGLATRTPDAATPESPSALLRWLDVDVAISTVAEDNLRVCLERIAEMLAPD